MLSRNWQAIALAGVTVFAVACGGDQAAEGAMDEPADTPEPAAEQTMADVELPEGVTMEMVSQGQVLFAGAGGCAACHNPQATGTQLAPDLTDDAWLNVSSRDYDEIVALIKSGVAQPVEHPGAMPPMGGANLTDAQVNALSAYIISLGA